jgi:hypothetical protein
MLNKTLFALSAVALLGTVSLASAQDREDVAFRLGDRYPAQTQGWNQKAAKVSTKAVAYEDVESRIGDKYPALEPSAASRVIALRHASPRAAYEDVAFRIGDRYPTLEPAAKPSLGTTVAMRRNGHKV